MTTLRRVASLAILSLALAGAPRAEAKPRAQLLPVAQNRWAVALAGHGGFVSGLAFSPDGRYLASSSSTLQDRSTRLWDVARRKQVARYPSNHSPLFSPDGRYLATSATDGSGGQPRVMVAVRRVGQQKPLFVVEGGNPVFSPNGDWLAVDTRNTLGIEVVELYAIPSGKAGATLEGRGAAFGPDGVWLATSSLLGGDWVTQVWDTRTGLPAKGFQEFAYVQGDKAVLCPPLYIATRTNRRPGHLQSRLYSLESGKPVHRPLEGVPLGFQHELDWLLTEETESTPSPRVHVYDLHRGTRLETVPGRPLALSPNGRWLATAADYDGLYPGVQLWNLIARKRGDLLFAGSDRATAAAFSGDGRLVAVASAGSKEILIYELDRG
ncbi:MAG TPA: hypothetical protein VEI97_19570 [bacterium]|nr:hypothetical protein [bacterium]